MRKPQFQNKRENWICSCQTSSLLHCRRRCHVLISSGQLNSQSLTMKKWSSTPWSKDRKSLTSSSRLQFSAILESVCTGTASLLRIVLSNAKHPSLSTPASSEISWCNLCSHPSQCKPFSSKMKARKVETRTTSEIDYIDELCDLFHHLKNL